MTKRATTVDGNPEDAAAGGRRDVDTEHRLIRVFTFASASAVAGPATKLVIVAPTTSALLIASAVKSGFVNALT